MTVTNNTTINAKAFKSGYNPSALAAASFTNTGTGTSYYVAKTGSDSNSCAQARSPSTPKLTIVAGIACLASGDTLIIKAGTYRENLASWVNANIPNGMAGAPTTIKANPGDTVTLMSPDSPITSSLIEMNAGMNRRTISYITFVGLILDGEKNNVGTVKSGFRIAVDATYRADHISFLNGEIKNFPEQGILEGGSFHQYANNHIHHNGGGCFQPGHCHGIYLTSSDTVIQNNEFDHNEAMGIQVFGYPFPDSADRTIVRNNLVHDNGVGLDDGTPSPASGIFTSGIGDGVEVYNNLIWNNPDGIAINWGSSNTYIYNNTIYNNTKGAPSAAHSCIWNGTDTTGTIIRNNICWQNPGAIIDDTRSAVKSNNLMTDPLFVNPATWNFHLQSGSPAINAGATITMISDDYSGVLRPQGTGYDIGAYEYAVFP
jgi:hypothetical protein